MTKSQKVEKITKNWTNCGDLEAKLYAEYKEKLFNWKQASRALDDLPENSPEFTKNAVKKAAEQTEKEYSKAFRDWKREKNRRKRLQRGQVCGTNARVLVKFTNIATGEDEKSFHPDLNSFSLDEQKLILSGDFSQCLIWANYSESMVDVLAVKLFVAHNLRGKLTLENVSRHALTIRDQAVKIANFFREELAMNNAEFCARVDTILQEGQMKNAWTDRNEKSLSAVAKTDDKTLQKLLKTDELDKMIGIRDYDTLVNRAASRRKEQAKKETAKKSKKSGSDAK